MYSSANENFGPPLILAEETVASHELLGWTPAMLVIGRSALTQHYHEWEPDLVLVSKFCMYRKA